MATTKEATLIIFDIGKNTGKSIQPGQPSFFEQAKQCLAKILQRKIFSAPKDEIGLILVGSDCTNNALNKSLGDYENISVALDLEQANWQMLRIVEREIVGPSNSEGDWLDALIVAMDFLKTQTLGKKFKSMKIILMSPFDAKVFEDNFEVVLEGLQKMEMEVVVIFRRFLVRIRVAFFTVTSSFTIFFLLAVFEVHLVAIVAMTFFGTTRQLIFLGCTKRDVDRTCNLEYYSNPDKSDENEEMVMFSQTANKTEEQKKGEKLVYDLIQKTDGNLCCFEEAMVQLVYFEKKKQRSIPWNCDLQIGSKLEIKVAAYVYIKDVPSLASWKTESADGPCKTVTEYFVQDIELKPVTAEELIKGHMYGSTPVPFDDSLGMKFDAGGKSFRCIGFTSRKNINDTHLSGTGVWMVVPQKGASASEKLFVAMVNVMRSSSLAMIARYVYGAKTKVKIMVLVPHPDNEKNQYKRDASLLMMELHFADDAIKMDFPSLKTSKDTPSEEQYEAVEELIDSMDLMNAYDHDGDCNEAFVHKKLLNPTIQNTYRALAHRALYPTLPVPLPDKDLMDLLDIPPKIKENSAEHVAKIKELFPLETIVKPTKKMLFQKLQHSATAVTLDDVESAAVVDQESTLIEVGTVTPDEDFMHLLLKGEKFATICNQMQNVLYNLVFKAVQLQTEKIARSVMMYREQAILLGAYRYNEWVVEFKKILLERNKVDVWENIFVQERFGLISAKECEMSTISDEEVEAFYKNEVAGTRSGADDMQDDDLDDLLANM
ncbi:X-ray repair cross-complementing protein 5 [Pseudolycoriella hygida]|uniref:X-ray repair cross-complementing protein 5 n=1 Tax=Pseudolycoriella hygida TaxID=35572 RepID=A0A9Q0N8A4_9DIPT|nr:X-ray repair cross-complementing protein 5 [Pseudolycoriella hygida]